MKWFKHLTNSHNDEKLAQLLAEHGAEGYGFWWLLVELIAQHTGNEDDKCQVSYPVSYWMRVTGFYHVAKLRKLLQSLSNLSLISVQCSVNLGTISSTSLKNVITISIPNILKYRDEYSKKSGQKKESVGAKNKKEIQKEIQNIKPIKDDDVVEAVKLNMTSFRFVYQEKFGQPLPGGCNHTANELCRAYTSERIKQAFDVACQQNILKLSYVEAVLEGKGKPRPNKDVIPFKTFEQQRLDNMQQAARDFVEGMQ